jgi:prepilin-type N-terminal cleavage/methylation domain-containing protein
MIKRSKSGFTLIEIMIALFIISVLLTIVVNSYVRSNVTAKNTICITNLKAIDSAIDQWALENHIANGTSISGYEDEVYDDYMKGSRPKCSAGGEYVFGAVGVRPQVTCTKEDEGHALP